MKPISNDFKAELLKFGREYENIIGIFDYDVLATEDNDFLVTEDDKDIISGVSKTDYEKELDDVDIYSIKLITKGEILSTLMKELDFETTEDIEIGKVIDYRLGLKIPNDDTEFINYGKFIVYKKEYDETTERYTYTCYDYMLRSMRVIGNEFNRIGMTATGKQIIEKICEVLTFDFDESLEDEDHKPTPFAMIGHKDQVIDITTLLQTSLTYRDLLGLVCQYFGVSMYMENNELKLKLLGNIEYDETEQEWYVNNDEPTIVATITEDYLQDSNVSFKEKYGKINALELTGIDESKQQYVQDAQSISDNGLTLYSIKKNILFNDNTVWNEHGYDMTEDIFKLIDGVEFYENDISTNGVLFLEWLDFYNMSVRGNTYKCLLLNSEITIKSGIQETIYTDIPTETVSEYTTKPSTSDDVIANSVRARGNIYATNVEASGRVDANIINANEVGEELAEVIRQISPGGGAEIPIQDTAPENPEEDDLWIDTSSVGGTDILQLVYPVGSIYMSVNNINPGTLFGGTWESWGAGRVPVGVDTTQTEFDTVEETGGSKTHTHGFASGNAWANIGSPNYNANALGFSAMNWHGTKSTYSVGDASSSQASGHPNRSHDTSLGGSTDGATTLQPYITCYMWKRTA